MIIEYYNLFFHNVCFVPLTVNNQQWTSSFFDEQRLFCHGNLDHTSNRYSNISQGLNPNTTCFNKIYWFSNIPFCQCHYVRLRHADCWYVVWQGKCIFTTISGSTVTILSPVRIFWIWVKIRKRSWQSIIREKIKKLR